MRKLFIFIVILLVVSISGCEEAGLLISSYSLTKDTITIVFSGDVAFTPPRSLRVGSSDYEVDIYRDEGTVTLFRLGHYGLLNTTDNSITLAVLGDFGDLSVGDYNIKIYTGDFMTPNVAAETENFSFTAWNQTNSDIEIIIHDPDEIYVTVAEGESEPLLEGLVKANFTLFQTDGTKVDFNFSSGPPHEYQLTPISGEFSGSYYVRFIDATHNPSNEYFTIGE